LNRKKGFAKKRLNGKGFDSFLCVVFVFVVLLFVFVFVLCLMWKINGSVRRRSRKRVEKKEGFWWNITKGATEYREERMVLSDCERERENERE
jgi:uncharacterized membrane protein